MRFKRRREQIDNRVVAFTTKSKTPLPSLRSPRER
jgi:hypothetical protein